MISFHDVTLSDRDWLRARFAASDFRGSEYNFSNAFNWQRFYGIQAAPVWDHAVIRSRRDGISYLYPVGTGPIRPVLEALLDFCVQEGHPFRMHSIPERGKEQMEALFPGIFVFEETRDIEDYLYEREKLAALSGKKLHSKRNHINRFLENNSSWTYEPITAENMDDVRRMNALWCEKMDAAGEIGLWEETQAAQSALDHFEDLGLVGGLLRVSGEPIAYSIGERLNSNTFIVHIEKAFPEIQGAYPMINQQFVLNAAQGYEFINREDDTGDEGLRRAKKSYYPALILPKYSAVLAREN